VDPAGISASNRNIVSAAAAAVRVHGFVRVADGTVERPATSLLVGRVEVTDVDRAVAAAIWANPESLGRTDFADSCRECIRGFRRVTSPVAAAMVGFYLRAAERAVERAQATAAAVEAQVTRVAIPAGPVALRVKVTDRRDGILTRFGLTSLVKMEVLDGPHAGETVKTFTTAAGFLAHATVGALIAVAGTACEPDTFRGVRESMLKRPTIGTSAPVARAPRPRASAARAPWTFAVAAEERRIPRDTDVVPAGPEHRADAVNCDCAACGA
jgi:hypothetical protein